MCSLLDWSDREDVRLHQPRCVTRFRFRSTRVRGQHSPVSLLYITMILRVRRIFFEITTFPNTCMLNLHPHRVIHNNYSFMMDDMFYTMHQISLSDAYLVLTLMCPYTSRWMMCTFTTRTISLVCVPSL